MKILTTRLKHVTNILTFTLLLFTLLISSKLDFISVKNTIDTFINITFPSLFPFILFVQVCNNTDVFYSLNKLLLFLPKIFKTTPNTAMIIFLSYLSGFPTSATMCNSMYEKGSITKKDAFILSTFTNNCSPIFIIVTVGIALLNNLHLGLLLFASHIISSIIIGFVFSKIYTYIIHENYVNLKYNSKKSVYFSKKNLTFFDILSKSLNSSFKVFISMFGFMLFFNIVSNLLCNLLYKFGITNSLIIDITTGLFEVVEGVKNISNNNYLSYCEIVKYLIYISVLLGFSGLSVIFQVKNEFKSICIPLKNLIFTKILHGILSGFVTYILLKYSNVLDTSLINVYSNIEMNKDEISEIYNYYINICAISLFVASTILVINYKRKVTFPLSPGSL